MTAAEAGACGVRRPSGRRWPVRAAVHDDKTRGCPDGSGHPRLPEDVRRRAGLPPVRPTVRRPDGCGGGMRQRISRIADRK